MNEDVAKLIVREMQCVSDELTRVQAYLIEELADDPLVSVDNPWISVEDAMPEKGVTVLGFDEFYRDIGLAEWPVSGYQRLIWVSGGNDCYITRWAPLPSPPRKI